MGTEPQNATSSSEFILFSHLNYYPKLFQPTLLICKLCLHLHESFTPPDHHSQIHPLPYINGQKKCWVTEGRGGGWKVGVASWHLCWESLCINYSKVWLSSLRWSLLSKSEVILQTKSRMSGMERQVSNPKELLNYKLTQGNKCLLSCASGQSQEDKKWLQNPSGSLQISGLIRPLNVSVIDSASLFHTSQSLTKHCRP